MESSAVEIAPKHIVSTIAYNGQFPGPLLRFKEGQSVTVDVHNDTDTPEQLHWHGQFVSTDVDGAAEEGTPFVPPRGMRRIVFTPRPAGFRFYHTHNRAGADLHAGQYSGQVGLVYIEPKHEPGRYDREVFLVLKEFEPSFSQGGDMAMDFLAPATRVKEMETTGESAMKASLAKGMPHGYEVGYRYFTINGRMLGHGEPVRVKRGLVGAFSVVLAFLGLHPLLLLPLAGGVVCLTELRTLRLSVSAFPVSAAPAGAVAGTAASFSLSSLFLVFLKVGAVVFGSGYVLLAFLRADLVVHRGWLTDSQLVDAVAVGQLTPAPVFTTATFVGYFLGGVRGALVATVGIFVPAFLLVAASGPLVPRLRKSKIAGAFLDGVNVGSLALIAEVTWQLGRTSLVDTATVVLAVASVIALLRFRLNSAWLILIGTVVGLIIRATQDTGALLGRVLR